MKKPLHWVAAAGAILLVPLLSVDSARAIGLSLSGGTSEDIPTNFNPAIPGGSTSWSGSSLLAGGSGFTVPGTSTVITTFDVGGTLSVVGGPYTITFTYLGAEAGDLNESFSALFGSTAIFQNQPNNSNTQAPVSVTGVTAGTLPFYFQNTNTGGIAPNGGTPTLGTGIAFDLVSPTFAIAFFDDAGDAPPFDHDFDDMVVGINITGGNLQPTPLPAALPLFVFGIGAIGLLAWRSKRKNSAAIAA